MLSGVGQTLCRGTRPKTVLQVDVEDSHHVAGEYIYFSNTFLSLVSFFCVFFYDYSVQILNLTQYQFQICLCECGG